MRGRGRQYPYFDSMLDVHVASKPGRICILIGLDSRLDTVLRSKSFHYFGDPMYLWNAVCDKIQAECDRRVHPI